MANLAGDFTVAVNGEDVPQIYNGATWVDAVITQDPSIVPPFPGFDPKNFIHVTQMHRRLWFTEKNSPRVWYLPTDVVQGAVKLFDCGEVFPLGDQSIFVSSKGNIAVFSGFDPDDVTTFTLAGVYTTGATFSRRCAAPYGSDVLLLGENGVVTLTSILSQSKMLMQPPLTDIIQHRISDLVTRFSTQFGWDLFTNARYNQLYLNVPDPERNYQYAMNTILDAWTVFLGYNALCWENFYEEPVFGADGYVGRSWAGFVDDPDPTTNIGQSIQTRCLQAFSYFGGPEQKNWLLARPVFIADTEPALVVFFNTDFEIVESLAPLPPFQNAADVYLWDSAVWDAARWSGQPRSWKRWFGLNNIGFAGAIFLRTASISDTIWLATDFQFIKGGTL
jgi:hypothetical protein